MDARETTTNNADLWTRFLADQWRAWLDPLGLFVSREGDPARAIAEATAANVASLLTVLVGQPIERLYVANAPEVTRFVQETAIAPESVEIPPQYAYAPPTADVARAAAMRPNRASEVAAAGAF